MPPPDWLLGPKSSWMISNQPRVCGHPGGGGGGGGGRRRRGGGGCSANCELAGKPRAPPPHSTFTKEAYPGPRAAGERSELFTRSFAIFRVESTSQFVALHVPISGTERCPAADVALERGRDSSPGTSGWLEITGNQLENQYITCLCFGRNVSSELPVRILLSEIREGSHSMLWLAVASHQCLYDRPVEEDTQRYFQDHVLLL